MDFDEGDEEQVELEAERKELIRESFTRWLVHQPDGNVHKTDYYNDFPIITGLEKLAKRIASTTTAPTKTVVASDGTKLSVPTRIGEEAIAICDVFDSTIPSRHRHHTFNPWIGAMLVALCHWCREGGFTKGMTRAGIVPEDREALDRIVRFVRRVCNSRTFKATLAQERKLARQNFDGACAYIVSLFTRCSRLLILRIDLYYRGKGKEWARTEEAGKTFDGFLDSLRRSRIVPDVLGCIMRCEEGPERGIHFHVLVAIDGHKRKDAYGLTETIGKAWLKRNGDSLGSYFNCYTRRHEYRFNGLGLVHLSDWRKLIGLRVALRYITKPEYQVKDRVRVKERRTGTKGDIKKRRGRKNFRKGLMHHDDVKLGAPRLPGHEMSTVFRILGPARRVGHSK